MTTPQALADRLEQTFTGVLQLTLANDVLAVVAEAVAFLRQAWEPVAYRYRYSNQGGWYVNSSPVASKALRERPGFQEQALYAAPPHLSGEIARLTKELAEAKTNAAAAERERIAKWLALSAYFGLAETLRENDLEFPCKS